MAKSNLNNLTIAQLDELAASNNVADYPAGKVAKAKKAAALNKAGIAAPAAEPKTGEAEKAPEPEQSAASEPALAEQPKDEASERVQEKVDELEEQGFLGVKVDPTPNENYSLETPPDAPTPETDPKLASQVGSTRFHGLDEEEVKRDA